MKIYLATDHAGYELKEKIKKHLQKKNYSVEDCGAHTLNNDDDYPDFISKAAKAVSQNPQDRAIILGGSGQGEAILANKYPQVRAVVFYGPCLPKSAVDNQGRKSDDPYEMIRLTREHNDANVLSLAARLLTEKEALEAIDLWLSISFSGNSRYLRRINKTLAIEKAL